MRVPKQIKEYPYIHISSDYLGRNFTMTPRVPSSIFMDTDGFRIEDPETKRVCFTTKGIKAAMNAVSYGSDCFYIYGAKKLSGLKILNKKKPLSTRNNKYGENFLAVDWIKWFSKKNPNLFSKKEINLISTAKEITNYFGYPKNLNIANKKELLLCLIRKHLNPKLKECVPDAAKTGEVWATKKVKVKLIGYAHYTNDSNDEILISYV